MILVSSRKEVKSSYSIDPSNSLLFINFPFRSLSLSGKCIIRGQTSQSVQNCLTVHLASLEFIKQLSKIKMEVMKGTALDLKNLELNIQ